MSRSGGAAEAALLYQSYFFFHTFFALQLFEPRQFFRYAVETTITMAPNLEDEAAHNNFDVCIINTLRRAGTASLETHLSPALRNLRSIAAVAIDSYMQKNGFANTGIFRQSLFSILAYVDFRISLVPLSAYFR